MDENGHPGGGSSRSDSSGHPSSAPQHQEPFTAQQLVEMEKGNTKLRLLAEAIHSRNIATDYAASTAKSEIYLRNVKRKYLMITFLCLGALGIVIVMLVVDVYLRYGDVVSMFNKYRAPYMPSAFNLGFALRVPAIAGWLGFHAKALPEAVYVSYKSQALNGLFMAKPAQNLAVLFSYARWMGASFDESGNPSAITLVCNSWVRQASSDPTLCERPCPPGSGAYASSYISDGISGAAQTLMMAEMGPFAIIGSLGVTGFQMANTAGLITGQKPNADCIGSDTVSGCSIM